MFNTKPYINVRGIGRINCKLELSLSDVRAICMIASSLPFVDELDSDENATGKTLYMAESAEYAFWVALLSVATEYPTADRDLWADLHKTNIASKLATRYACYMDELRVGTSDRIAAKLNELNPQNTNAVLNDMAKTLGDIDVGELINMAASLSKLDNKEIVKAVLETEAP